MAVTLDQLASAVHQFFLQKLPGAGGDTPGSVALVFDGFGTPLEPGEFGAGATDSQQQLLAHQRAAQLADQIPAAGGLASGWYLPRTGSRLSRWYHTVLGESVRSSNSDQDAGVFDERKAAALKELEENKLLEIGGVTSAGSTVDPTGVHDTYYATGMSPTNWYLPQADCWETHHIDDTSSVPPAIQGISSSHDAIPVPGFDLRLSNPLIPTSDLQLSDPSSQDSDPPGTVVVMPQLIGSATQATITAWHKAVGDAVGQSDEPLAEVAADTGALFVFSPALGVLNTILVPEGATAEVGAPLAVIGPPTPPAPVAPPSGFSDPPGTVVVMPQLSGSAAQATVTAWHKAVGDAVQSDEPLAEVAADTGAQLVFSPALGVLNTILVPEGAAAEVGAPLAVIGPPTPPAPVAPPSGFSLTFDYCVVTFDRPWWDEVFLASSGWTVPGFARGQIGSGSASNPSTAAITMITVGMVVIRNLQITADWSDSDRQALTTSAVSLGPFSLSGAAVNDQTLTRPGMQATAWICQIPPVLPPS